MAMTAPPAPPPYAPEHVRARYWREHTMRLSRRELGEMLAMSESRIEDLERGTVRGDERPIDPASMQRYRLACAALTLGIEFDWVSLIMTTPVPVTITLYAPDKA
jgi:hypothetical protein